MAETARDFIRELAVMTVDGHHGATYEFSSDPAAHLHDYDILEEHISTSLKDAGLVVVPSSIIAALVPFSNALDEYGDDGTAPNSADIWEHPIAMNIKFEDLRKAAIAIAQLRPTEELREPSDAATKEQA